MGDPEGVPTGDLMVAIRVDSITTWEEDLTVSQRVSPEENLT
jgi:hypothetical protein